ncbi:MAG: hypothetical protein ACOX84_11730 [Methanothrix sp.]
MKRATSSPSRRIPKTPFLAKLAGYGADTRLVEDLKAEAALS